LPLRSLLVEASQVALQELPLLLHKLRFRKHPSKNLLRVGRSLSSGHLLGSTRFWDLIVM
jgi:hypothetical protein